MDPFENEIVRISPHDGVNDESICTVPSSFPDGQDLSAGAVGAVLEGKAVLCGGVEEGRKV